MKAYTSQELTVGLDALASCHDVRVPVVLPDGTRALGMPGDGRVELLADGAVPLKVSCVFLPPSDPIPRAEPHGFALAVLPDKPLLVVGLSARDVECLTFVDQFFGDRFRDDLYFRRWGDAVVACVSGRLGDGKFLRMAGGDCDLEFAFDGKRFLLATYTESGRAVASCLPPGHEVSPDRWEALWRESDALGADEVDLIRRAADLLHAGCVPETFWERIARRCTACMHCGWACPADRRAEAPDSPSPPARGRWREGGVGDTDGRCARRGPGTHTGVREALPSRRFRQKVVAAPTPWGTITCYVCGRCDRGCPAGICIESLCREIVGTYGAS